MEIKKEVILKTTSTWDGEEYESVTIKKPEATVLKITLPEKTKLAMHKHLMVNVVYILKGELTIVTDNGVERKVKAGESLAELIDKFHYGKNDGNEPVEMIIFYYGEKDTQLSVGE